MSTSIVPFDFAGQQVRVVSDEQDEPWFVAADVAKILGYSESAAMTRTLDEDEKGLRTVQTLGGDQQMVVVSEPGVFYTLVITPRGMDLIKRRMARIALPADEAAEQLAVAR